MSASHFTRGACAGCGVTNEECEQLTAPTGRGGCCSSCAAADTHSNTTTDPSTVIGTEPVTRVRKTTTGEWEWEICSPVVDPFTGVHGWEVTAKGTGYDRDDAAAAMFEALLNTPGPWETISI